MYLDVGNALYLENNVKNIDQMAINLLRVPGIKGKCDSRCILFLRAILLFNDFTIGSVLYTPLK